MGSFEGTPGAETEARMTPMTKRVTWNLLVDRDGRVHRCIENW